jgi:hypothetical protein
VYLTVRKELKYKKNIEEIAKFGQLRAQMSKFVPVPVECEPNAGLWK